MSKTVDVAVPALNEAASLTGTVSGALRAGYKILWIVARHMGRAPI